MVNSGLSLPPEPFTETRMRRLALPLALMPAAALAGEADVLEVRAERSGATWRFEATVSHADEGWEHYADAWRVVGPDGAVYGTRELLHPHVAEQPFTRSLAGVASPDGVSTVTLEARDSVHGWGGRTVEVALPE